MAYDPALHHRRSLRLPDYDYAQAGASYVTIVCKGRLLLFEDERLHSTVEQCWRWLGNHYDYVDIDEFVVMPNHLHGIIFINDRRGGSRAAPTTGSKGQKPFGQLIGAFKTVSTNRINQIRGTTGSTVWQRNYYEHIIRDEDELNRVREYIADNPRRWAEDPENPDRIMEGRTAVRPSTFDLLITNAY